MSVTSTDNLRPHGSWLYAGRSPGEETDHVAATLSFQQWDDTIRAFAGRAIEAKLTRDPLSLTTLTHHQDDERGWTEITLVARSGKPGHSPTMALTAQVEGQPPADIAEHFRERKTSDQEAREQIAEALASAPDNIPTPRQLNRLSHRQLGELLDATEERGKEESPRAIALRDELLRRM